MGRTSPASCNCKDESRSKRVFWGCAQDGRGCAPLWSNGGNGIMRKNVVLTTAARLPICAGVALLQCVALAFGQYSGGGSISRNSARTEASGQTGQDTLRVFSGLVVLDVVVTNKKGQIVNKLEEGDFQVFENEAPQAINSFERHEAAMSHSTGSVVSTADLDRRDPTAPVSIIVLDEISTSFQDEAFTRYALKKYLDSQGASLVQPTMLVATNPDHLSVLRDYTTSKAEILSALDRHRAPAPWQFMGGGKEAQYRAAFVSLMQVAKATSAHRGHKNMIWIGRGFPAIGEDALASLPVDARTELRDAISLCVNALRDARVTLYTLDPAGVSAKSESVDASGMGGNDPFAGDIDFGAMARATGGKSFYGRNDLNNLIDESVRAGTNFYTLSYVPRGSEAGAKAYRAIRVVMRDSNFQAATREGYYAERPSERASTAGEKMSDRTAFELNLASASTIVYDALPITVTRAPDSPNVFHIHITSSDLVWERSDSQKVTARLALIVESFDRQETMLNRTAKNLDLRVSAADDGVSPIKDGLDLVTTIPTMPPAVRLRFVVRSISTGKIGAINFPLNDTKIH
jgi:VWFA-related protein